MADYHNKKKWLFYRDWLEYFTTLSDKDAGCLIKALSKWVIEDKVEIIENISLMEMFFFIVHYWKDAGDKWLNQCEQNKLNAQSGASSKEESKTDKTSEISESHETSKSHKSVKNRKNEKNERNERNERDNHNDLQKHNLNVNGNDNGMIMTIDNANTMSASPPSEGGGEQTNEEEADELEILRRNLLESHGIKWS